VLTLCSTTCGTGTAVCEVFNASGGGCACQ
jgi:hypothetical protein